MTRLRKRMYQAGQRGRRLLHQELGQGDGRRGVRHSRASPVASRRMASSTVEAFRAASRKAIRPTLLILRRMPLAVW